MTVISIPTESNERQGLRARGSRVFMMTVRLKALVIKSVTMGEGGRVKFCVISFMDGL